MEIHFKPLKITDISCIVKLMQDFYAIDNYSINKQKTELLFTQFIDNPSLGQSWLIYLENQVVGYVIVTYIFSFEYQGKYAFIDELYLCQNARGKGIGKKVIDFIKAQAKKQEIKVLYLEVEKHNQNAQKLYIANDFIVHQRQLMKHTVK